MTWQWRGEYCMFCWTSVYFLYALRASIIYLKIVYQKFILPRPKLEIALRSVNDGVCYILNKGHSRLQMSNCVFLFLAPASRNEYQTIKQQLEVEKIPGLEPGDPPRSFHSLTNVERAQMEKKRLAGFLNEFYFCPLSLFFIWCYMHNTDGVFYLSKYSFEIKLLYRWCTCVYEKKCNFYMLSYYRIMPVETISHLLTLNVLYILYFFRILSQSLQKD